MIGSGGIGKPVDLAFEDFVTSWCQLKGFEWTQKNR